MYMHKPHKVTAVILFAHTDWKKIIALQMNRIREGFFAIQTFLAQITVSKFTKYCTRKYVMFAS